LIDSGNPPQWEGNQAPDDPETPSGCPRPPDGWLFPLRKWMKQVIEWQLGWRET